MFKLIKIQHSGVNVPEYVRLPVTASTSYKVGSALIVTAGKAANCAATDKPTHIAAENLSAGAASTVLCYPITPGMIFETTFSVTPTSIAIGSVVTLNVVSSSAVGVTATTTAGVAKIHNLLGAAAAGDTVEVTF